MNDIHIPAGIRTPEIQFRFSEKIFLIKGESYPEDVRKFYNDPIASIAKHFAALSEGLHLVVIELKYFNSSTAKILMDLFLMLESSSQIGNRIKVEWKYMEGDDNMRDLGVEFSEELQNVAFELKSFAG